jgi:hypothetical protein
MWAVFAAAGFKLSNVDPREGTWALAEGVLSGVAAAMALVAIVAVPLGIPLVFVLGVSRTVWQEVWADPAVAGGIGVMALTGLIGAVRNVFALAEGRVGEAMVKQTFAILMKRWVLVLVAIYTLGSTSAGSVSTWWCWCTRPPVPGASSPRSASPVSSPTAAPPAPSSEPRHGARIPMRTLWPREGRGQEAAVRRRTAGSTSRPRSSRPARISSWGIPGQLIRMVAWVTPARC